MRPKVIDYKDLAWIVMLVLSFPIISAATLSSDCLVKPACAANEIDIMSISSASTNAQAGDSSAYANKVCCAYSDPIDPFSINDCPNTLLKLSSQTNAHVASTSDPNYPWDICLDYDAGLDCILMGECAPSQKCVIELEGKYLSGPVRYSNAHIQECGVLPSYDLKLCCSPRPCNLKEVTIEPVPCGDGVCLPGEVVNVHAEYEWDCSPQPYIQVHATGGSCTLSYPGGSGDMDGIYFQCFNEICDGQWTVPDIPPDCVGQTVIADPTAELWEGIPNSGTSTLKAIDFAPVGSVTFGNPIPSITSCDASPDPVPIGSVVTFTAGWSGPGPVYMLACTGSGASGWPPTCNWNTWASAGPTDVSPVQATYTVQASDVGTNNAIIHVCNQYGCRYDCSDTFTVYDPGICDMYDSCYDEAASPYDCYYSHFGLPGPAFSACCTGSPDIWEQVIVGTP